MSAKHYALGIALVLGVFVGAGCGGGDNGSLGGRGGSLGQGGPGTPGYNPNHSGGTGPGMPGNPTGPGPTPMATGAQGYFLQTVYPALTTSPGTDASGAPIPPCSTCHATGAFGAPTFLAGADAAGAYATITSTAFHGLIAIPANSLLILHGAHTGPALTPADSTIVTTWLGMEAMERNLPMTPGKTLLGELTKIGKCMQYGDFTAQTANGAAASDIYGSRARFQGNDVQCQRCHNVGDGGFYADADSTTTFAQTQANLVFIKKYFSGTVDATGSFAGLVASGSISQKVDLTQVCGNQAACHPRIELQTTGPESDVLVAIDTFVTTTLTRYNANMCP